MYHKNIEKEEGQKEGEEKVERETTKCEGLQ